MNIVPFSFELAKELYHSTQQFPVDFEQAWLWLEYSTKGNAKRVLEKNFIENEDYQVIKADNVVKRFQGGGSQPETISLTVDCFKELGMMAGTEKGKLIRQHFIQCEKQLKALLAAKQQPAKPPHWYRRLGLFRTKTKIPVGYWCIFEEIVGTIADLEQLGYIPPEGIIPDISVGKCWCNHLRSNLKVNPKDIGKKYKHYYPDWAHSVSPYIYPLEYLPEFRVWFEQTYKPQKMLTYFKNADPVALPSVCKLLGLPEGK